MTALELVAQARMDGVTVRAKGNVLTIKASSVALKKWQPLLAARKPEILAALAPHQCVMLRGGLSIPLPALQLAWSLEDRGIHLRTDAHHQLVVPHGPKLTDADRMAIARWHLHLAAVVEYIAPEVN